MRIRRAALVISCALMGSLLQGSAGAQIGGMGTYYMSGYRNIAQGTNAAQITPLVTIRLSAIGVGDSVLLAGKAVSERLYSGANVDTGVRIQCTDDSNPSGGVHFGQRGTNPPLGTPTTLFENWLFVRPASLGGLPTSPYWSCTMYLVTEAGGTKPPVGTAIARAPEAAGTYLAVSNSVQPGARQVEGHPCASNDINTGTCKYIGSAVPSYSVFGDSSPWAALSGKSLIDVVADTQVTTCYRNPQTGAKTSSCSIHGGNGYTEFRYRLSVPQVTSAGATCRTNLGAWSEVITLNNWPTHHLPLHDRRSVSVDPTCVGGLFVVKFEVLWIRGDPLKLDGVETTAPNTLVRAKAILMNT